MPHVPYRPRPLPPDVHGGLAPSLPPKIYEDLQPGPKPREKKKAAAPQAKVPLMRPKDTRPPGQKLGLPVISLRNHQVSPEEVARRLLS